MKNKSFVKYLLGFVTVSIMLIVFSFPVSANETEVDTTILDIQTENTETTNSNIENDVETTENETVIYDPEIDTAIPDEDYFDGDICPGQVAEFEETTEYDDSVITITPIYDPDEYVDYDTEESTRTESENQTTETTGNVTETETQKETEAESTGESDGDEEPKSLGWIIGGIAIAVVGAAGIIAVAVIKKKK